MGLADQADRRKIMSIKDEILKAQEKVKKDQERVKELKRKLVMEQDAEIVRIVRESNLSIEDLRELLGTETKVKVESEELENE